jgi:ribosomal protein S18 acetylase RimI-like enzyme
MILNIRNLTTADFNNIDPVLRAAYGTPSSFQSELQIYLQLQPDGWLIAECDGVPVGMVGAVDYGTFAYIGLLSVHPSFQRRGIGQSLMERILAWLDERGSPNAVLDATELGTPLYTKLGFVEDEKSLVFIWNSGMQELSASESVSELRSDDLAAVTAFDTPLFGANRQAVLTAFLNQFPHRAFLVRDSTGQIIGYLFAQLQKLGPWVATTPTAAAALLTTALQLSFNGTPRVLVPSLNRAAITLLQGYGFKEERSLSHMRRGRSALLGKRTMLYGMASFALG